MKKGQAAVEYLTTYGWAILILLIVLAVLFSSGILSPSYLISEECTFGNSLGCNFALFNDNINGPTKLNLDIHNGFAYKINITKVELMTQDGTQNFNGFATGVVLDSGETGSFQGTLEGSPVKEGTVKRFVGSITYVSCATELGPDCSDVEHTLTGRIVGKVIPQ
ncbi:hypothetical protein H0N98_01850 [Candidatus Micrarchaeota archaeon]|nr:hypothetical protein [Candidatus Micrarchaeota archaeon]